LYAPEEVLEILDGAARRRVKELLVLTGERPEVNAEVHARLRSYGHEDFTGYVAWACERALERGLLPHTNLGVLERGELARRREPAQIADAAAREYWRTGVSDGRPALALPEWACPVGIEDLKRLIAETRRLMPDVGIQVPPNLSDWWPELVAAGATDLGGLSL